VAKGQVIEAVAEEVAENLEEAAAVARKLDTRVLAIGLVGIGIGLTVGFIVGRRWQKQKAEDAAWRKAEVEITEIRDRYRRNSEGSVVVQPKPDLEDVVEERGYSQRVTVEEVERPTKPPVPITSTAYHTVTNDPKRKADTEKDKYEGWDWEIEMAGRKDRPYVIHQDEFFNRESEYSQMTYTYYSADEIVADESNTKIEEPNHWIGVANLERFGVGTDDWDVLYVRNDEMHLEFEICRVDKSYEEEVEGIVHDISADDETDDGDD